MTRKTFMQNSCGRQTVSNLAACKAEKTGYSLRERGVKVYTIRLTEIIQTAPNRKLLRGKKNISIK